jgi:hypothetical protein
MIHKPEHVVDLGTGAIMDADVRPADEHDTADEGYFKREEISILLGPGIEPAISDSHRRPRTDRLSEEDRKAL